jgi:hypothetical protein
MSWLHHANLYVFRDVDPVSDGYHADGAVVIVTRREPQEAWLDYVDQRRANRPATRYSGPLDWPGKLGEPAAVFDLAGHPPESVLVLARGCCCER